MVYGKTSVTESNNSLSLEELFKKQDYSNEVTIKLNFIKKKSGEDKLINILRYLDKMVGQVTEKEAYDKISLIVGEQNFSSIQHTLTKALKCAEYKFKV